MHECELVKSDKMRDCLVDGARNFYCKSCGKLLSYEDVHPEIIEKYGK